jgi:hypothetical protein
MMMTVSFGGKLLTLNINLEPLIFFVVKVGRPPPFGKGSCGPRKRPRSGIGDMSVMAPKLDFGRITSLVLVP